VVCLPCSLSGHVLKRRSGRESQGSTSGGRRVLAAVVVWATQRAREASDVQASPDGHGAGPACRRGTAGGEQTMSKIGYARVSTDDQHAEGQAERLIAAGCDKVFTDKGVSGALRSRPELDKCLDYLRTGDVLVRSARDSRPHRRDPGTGHAVRRLAGPSQRRLRHGHPVGPVTARGARQPPTSSTASASDSASLIGSSRTSTHPARHSPAWQATSPPLPDNSDAPAATLRDQPDHLIHANTARSVCSRESAANPGRHAEHGDLCSARPGQRGGIEALEG
jgi:hypothetical protein